MSNLKIQIRPVISGIKDEENTSTEEKFQNNVLRPIIKLQHELIISYFENYIKLKKINIKNLDKIQKKEFFQKKIKNDTQFKTDLRSLIIGLFTLDEYNEYLISSSSINKRINSIIQQRLTSFYL